MRLGAEGNAISGGQKQRIAIAPAVYKNPTFIFFDEATNLLDANNEKMILENPQQFFKGKTVLVAAERRGKGMRTQPSLSALYLCTELESNFQV